MIFKTVCSWCNCFISERDYPASKHCQALAIDGKILSHGICQDCKAIVAREYKLKLKRRKKHV